MRKRHEGKELTSAHVSDDTKKEEAFLDLTVAQFMDGSLRKGSKKQVDRP
eukprot:m.68679 g.68679  ORF g.68679 m.68679 type:complete len:50 (-) comp13692_c1_seq2:912-1061(-)